MNPISLEFDNRLDEHLHADRLLYSRGVLAKVDKGVAALLLAAGVAGVALAGVRWWTLVFFPLSVAEWFNLLSIRPLQIRSAFRSNPKFKERYTLVFGEEEIHFRTATVDSHLKWDHYGSWMESDRIFLLVYGRRMYTVVPKRAFSDATRLEEFRQFLGNKLTPASGS